MDRHTPVSDFIAGISSHKDMGESSWNHGDGGVSASMLPYSSTIAALGEDDDYFQNAAIYPMIQDPRGIELENSKCIDQEIAGESQGLERREQNVGHQPKQKRCGKTHTISERRRRERIRAKIQALQELIPYSNKWDKASILDEAINYIKSLKLQVEMMISMGGGALFLSPFGIRASQVVSELPLVMQMRGGMVGMYFSTMPTSAGLRLPLMSGSGTRSFCFPHLQLPVPAAATQTMLPNFVTPAVFNYSSQGESTSQNIDCREFDWPHKRRDPPMEETQYQNA